MHIYSSPFCVCNDCMGLRMVKSEAWMQAWTDSFRRETSLTFGRRKELVELYMLSQAPFTFSAPTPQSDAPPRTYLMRPDPEVLVVAGTGKGYRNYEEYVQAALQASAATQTPPPTPTQPAAARPAAPAAEPKKDRFELIELD